MLVDSRDRHQHISYVARIISYHMRSAALTTSLHTFTKSLYRARDSCLRRFLLSNGWRRWRWEGGLPRWPWELNFHLWLMVLSLGRLEWLLAVLFDGPRASLR